MRAMRLHKKWEYGLLGALLMSAGQLIAFAQSSATINDPIPAQSIAAALSAFSRQTGLQVVYMSKIADGLMSSATPAGISAEQALRKILGASGLSFEFLNERTVTVFEAGSAQRASTSRVQRGGKGGDEGDASAWT